MLLRRFVASDAGLLWALNDLPNVGETADPDVPLDLPIPAEPPRAFPFLADIERHFLNRGGEFLVVMHDAHLLGMGGIRPNDARQAEVLHVRVHPATRRQGVGRLLMDGLEARGRGVPCARHGGGRVGALLERGGADSGRSRHRHRAVRACVPRATGQAHGTARRGALATWAGAVGPYWVDAVSKMVGPEWIDQQRRGSGWLLCGGRHDVTAVVWLNGEGGARLLATAQTPEGEAMGAFLLEAAPGLGGFEARPLAPSPQADATPGR